MARGAEAEQLLRVHGRNELEEKHTSKLLIFFKLVRCETANAHHVPGVTRMF